MYPFKKAQIAHLKVDKVSIEISSGYTDFADVFSLKLTIKLSEHTDINNHVIKLVHDRQLSYDLIYNLGPIELKTLKAYIKNNLANSFIRLFKFLTRALILFDKKPDKSLRLYVKYQDLNNLIIKNRYLLSLVKESLN